MTDWDKRYTEGDYPDDPPHPLIVSFASRMETGRALDVACGAGRHAIWLAEHGWQVTAVDNSRAAIAILDQRAREKGVTMDSRVADLERHEFVIEPESCDLIVICNYLQRDLFPAIKAGTRLNGIVIAIIAMVDDDPHVKPMNPAFLLNPAELRSQFEGWELIHDFEGKPAAAGHRRKVAEVIARRPDSCQNGRRSV
jgi:tellurite methyltransferase